MTFGGPWGDPFGSPPGQHSGPPVINSPHSAPQETNTCSTLSVVFAFLFAPAGAVLGHLGLAQIKRTGEPGRQRALIGLTLSYVFIVVAVVATVVWFTGPSKSIAAQPTTTSRPVAATSAVPAAPPPPAKVEAAGMTALLPSVEEMRAITHNPDLAVAEPMDKISLPDGEQSYSPVECASAFSIFTPRPYENSGYTAIASAVQQQKPTVNMQAAQGVAIFNDAAAAQQALARYVGIWRECAGKTLTWNFADQGRSANFTLGIPQDRGGIMALRSPNPGSQTAMQRAIGVKANVLVDVHILGQGLTDEAITVVQRIFDRIPN